MKPLYRNNLKNREGGKEAAQIFASGASDHCLWQGASEGQKDAAKPTTPKIDYSGCFGISAVVFKYLLSQDDFSFRDLCSWEFFKAVFLSKNEELLTRAWKDLEEALKVAAANEILTGHLLSLLPFFEPKQGMEITVRGVTYQIHPICLTPQRWGSPLYCYGLEATKGPPLLLFQGTSHPTCSGAIWTYWTDFIPFTSPGESIYLWTGKAQVEAWIHRQKSKPILYGASLGGCLALMTACDHPGEIAEVFAYSSPSLFPRFLRRYERAACPPKVRLYLQAGDVVPFLGASWHKDWEVYWLSDGRMRFDSHARLLSAVQGVKIERLEKHSLWHQVQRITFNVLHQLASFVLFIFLTPLVLRHGFRANSAKK
jgi:hypothetical protein